MTSAQAKALLELVADLYVVANTPAPPAAEPAEVINIDEPAEDPAP